VPSVQPVATRVPPRVTGTEAKTDFFVSNGLEPCATGKEGAAGEERGGGGARVLQAVVCGCRGAAVALGGELASTVIKASIELGIRGLWGLHHRQ
jgi:hypothetical protein